MKIIFNILACLAIGHSAALASDFAIVEKVKAEKAALEAEEEDLQKQIDQTVIDIYWQSYNQTVIQAFIRKDWSYRKVAGRYPKTTVALPSAVVLAATYFVSKPLLAALVSKPQTNFALHWAQKLVQYSPMITQTLVWSPAALAIAIHVNDVLNTRSVANQLHGLSKEELYEAQETTSRLLSISEIKLAKIDHRMFEVKSQLGKLSVGDVRRMNRQ